MSPRSFLFSARERYRTSDTQVDHAGTLAGDGTSDASRLSPSRSHEELKPDQPFVQLAERLTMPVVM